MTTSVGARAEPRAQAIADEARLALGATVVNVSKLHDDLSMTGLAWSVEPGTRYERALSAARRIMPGIDPISIKIDANINPFIGNVHLMGMTLVAPFEEASRYTVHPMVAGFASKMLEMRWTLSIPLRVGPKIVGSFSAHFPDRPTETQRARAVTFAEQLALELEKVGIFR